MGDPIRVLVIEDSESDALVVLRELRRGGFDPVYERVDTQQAMKAALDTNIWDLIICDYSMPHFSGPEALELMRDSELDLPFIIVSGKVGEETAVEMLKAGAHDFIAKDNFARLVPAVRRETKDAEVRRGARLGQAILKESETRFQTLARVSPVGIFQTDVEGKFLYVNEQWTEITGLLPEKAAGDGWRDAIHPRDRQRVVAEWQRCAAEKLPCMLEYRIRRSDERIIWVLGRSAPQLGDSGRIASFIGTITDVSRLKLTEEALRGSEADLKEAQRVARLGSWTWNVADDVVAWSGALSSIFGLDSSPPERKFASQAPLYSPESWAKLRSAIEATLFSGAPFELDLEVNSPSGPRWVSARGEVVASKDKSISVRGTLLDITDRKQAQLALEHSERRFRALMENSSDSIVVLDKEGIVSYASPSISRTGGYAVDEVVGRPVADFMHPEDTPVAQAEMAAVLADPNYTSFSELRYRHKEGYWIVLAAAATNVIDDPAVAGIVVNIRDVTERQRTRLALEESKQRLNEVMEGLPVMVCLLTPDYHVPFSNRSFRENFGEPHARRCFEYIADRSDPCPECQSFTPLRTNAPHRWEWHTPKGRDYEVYDVPFTDPDGSRLILEMNIDVTERRSQESRIVRLNRIRDVLSGINNVVVRVRAETELVEETCRIATERGGFLMAWVGILHADSGELRLLSKDAATQEFCDAIAPCLRLNGEGCDCFAEVLRKKRPYIMNDTAADPCPLNRGQAIARRFGSYVLLPLQVEDAAIGLIALYSGECGFFDDEELGLLTELAADMSFGWDYIAKDRKVSYLALYDPLTGLANRTLFAERLSEQLRQLQLDEGMTGLGIVEVERFHNINDTLGWHAGDLVLKTVAERLKLALGEASVARTDADCFSIAVGRVHGASEVLQIFERALRDCFGRPFVVGGTELRLSGRCGIALFPNDGADADTVQRNAAVALKKAKDSAERVLFYAPEMNARVGERMNLETRLHQALEQEQFVLHYQAKFDSKSGSLTGLEALIRWNDPQRGLVPPGDFIPLLEETGLIVEVGQWALERTVQQCNEWRRAHLKVPRVAVNVSAIQLRKKEFVAEVRRAVDQFQGECCLDLEITESLIMKDVEENISKLRLLKEAGVNTAIDDFGTGYSSLAYIAKLPVNALKIDRSFVENMSHGPEETGIVFTIISLAHHLDLKVVAEGVESEEQANLLKLLKCDEMQGFLFGKPMPASDVPALLSGAAAVSIIKSRAGNALALESKDRAI